MGGGNPGSEIAEEGISDAVNQLVLGQNSFMANPLFQGLQGLAGGAIQQAQQFGPEETARRQQQSAGTIHEAATGFLDRGMTRLAGTGSGTRGGAANQLLTETASRFAPALAQQNAQIERQVQEERNAALVNAFNLATNALGQQYAWPRDIASANLGGAGIAGPLANQPSPLAQGLGAGLGGLGALAGAPVAGGGSLIGNFFGGASGPFK